jgi:hypothetical protein
MGTPTTKTQPAAWGTPWQWSEDVLAFARPFGVEDALGPFLEATRRLFPTALSLEVSLEPDPGIAGLTFFVFDLRVPRADVPDYVKASHAWTDELRRLVPPSNPCPFCLHLHRVGA